MIYLLMIQNSKTIDTYIYYFLLRIDYRITNRIYVKFS